MDGWVVVMGGAVVSAADAGFDLDGVFVGISLHHLV